MPMQVSDAIAVRRSIRSYRNDPLTEDQIGKILLAGQMAPSAGNLQGREFIVVKDAETRHRLSDAALRQRFIDEAPVCIVVCTNLPRTKQRYGKRAELYVVQDTSASVMNMMLQACDLGLGTCWVGAFDEGEVAKILGVPEGIRPVAMMPVGVPDDKPEAPPRLGKKIEHYEHW
ncbi:MAG TPA: nitroreductase family protein [Methanocella sp.]